MVVDGIGRGICETGWLYIVPGGKFYVTGDRKDSLIHSNGGLQVLAVYWGVW